MGLDNSRGVRERVKPPPTRALQLYEKLFRHHDDNFTVRVAHNAVEAGILVEAGFEYFTVEYNDGGKILRKRE
jgi:hypothetical protein